MRKTFLASMIFACVAITSLLELTFASQAHAAPANSTNLNPTEIRLAPLLRAAANDYPKVKAEELRIRSTESSRTAALLDSATVSLSSSVSDSKTHVDATDLDLSVSGTTRSQKIGVQFVLSLSTWFQMRQLELTAETQRAALSALRMQNVAEAASSYFNYEVARGRLLVLDSLIKSLNKAKNEAGLSESSQAAIDAQLSALENGRAQILLKRSLSKNDMTKYQQDLVDEPLAPTLAAKRNDHDLWYFINNLLPIPKNEKDAYLIAQKSPALIQSQISEKAAENKWYLTLASAGPKLVASFSRQLSSGGSGLESSFPGAHISTSTFAVSCSISISGGYLSSLSADRLLQEAAREDTRATETVIQVQIRKAYLKDRDFLANLKKIDANLKKAMSELAAINKVTDQNVNNFLSLLASGEKLIEQMQETTLAYYENRIGLLGQIGTLLEMIDHIDRMEQKQ